MGVIIKESAYVSTDDSQSRQRLEMEQKYMDYLSNHIKNVKIAYIKYLRMLVNKDSIIYTVGINNALFTRQEFFEALADVALDIKTHDDSKYSDEEFEPYRKFWDPTEIEKTYDEYYKAEMEEEYYKAWVHHYTVNDHHPEHWYDFSTNTAKDMSLRAIMHMLCDWESFHIANPKGEDTIDWWMNKAQDERKVMSPRTIAIVDELLFNIIHPERKADYQPKESISQYVADKMDK